MIKCPKCGANNIDEDAFCTACGSSLQAGTEEFVYNFNSSESRIHTYKASEAAIGRRKKALNKMDKIVISVGVILSLLGIAIMLTGSLLFGSNSSQGNPAVVNENLLTVDILIPSWGFSESNPAGAELTQEQKDSGFKSAKVNEDGSVTYTVSKKAFNEIKEEMKQSTQKTLDEIPADSPSIKAVEYNDDFSEITFKVDKEAYQNSLDSISVLSAGLSGTIYQAYAGISSDKIKTVVKVMDVSTGELLNTVEYPTADEKI